MAILKKTTVSPEHGRRVKNAVTVKTIDELRAELSTKLNDLTEAKRGHRLGELTNPCVLKTTRKEIARLHTAIRADELTAKEGK